MNGVKTNYKINEDYLNDLQEGQLAVTLDWPNKSMNNGTLVQRFDDQLILVGQGIGDSYPHILETEQPREKTKVETEVEK